MAKAPHPPTPKHGPTEPAPAPDQDWKRLHLWQMQPVRDVLVLAGVCWVVYLGYILSVVTVPLLLALALAYLFEPVVRRLTERGWMSRGGAALAIIGVAGVLFFLPLTLGVGFATVQGVRYAQRVSGNVDQVLRSVELPEDQALRATLPNDSWRSVRDYLVRELKPRGGGTPPPTADPTQGPQSPAPSAPAAGDTGTTLHWLVSWLKRNSEAIGKHALATGAGAIDVLVRGASALGMAAFGSVLTAFFFYFFCTGYGNVLAFWRGLIPKQSKGRVLDLLDQMDRVIAGFIRGRLIIGVILCVYFSLGYWFIGTPAPLVLGVIVGALVIVPYVSAIGVPIAIVLMWLDPGTGMQANWWWIVFAPIVVYAIGQGLNDYVLTPLIQGKSMNMGMATILFVSLAGGVLAGFYGLLLAIPVGACLKILLNEVFWPRFRAWAEGKARDFLPIEPG